MLAVSGTRPRDASRVAFFCKGAFRVVTGHRVLVCRPCGLTRGCGASWGRVLHMEGFLRVRRLLCSLGPSGSVRRRFCVVGGHCALWGPSTWVWLGHQPPSLEARNDM